MIVRWKEYPVLEPVFFAEMEKLVNFCAVVSTWPRNVATNVSRSRGDEMSAPLQDPHGNAPTTQTSHYAQASVISTHHQCADVSVVLCYSPRRNRRSACSCVGHWHKLRLMLGRYGAGMGGAPT